MKLSRNPSILAAMAGTTTGEFANHCLTVGGAGMVTIGGFPVGREMIAAAKEAVQRGRAEFLLQNRNEASEIYIEAMKVSSLADLILNLRFNRTSHAKNFVHALSDFLAEKPVIEINAHCRQPEFTERGGGQSLINRPKLLNDMIKVFKSKDFRVSLKIRGNAVSSSLFISQVKEWQLDLIHIDSYKEGEEGTDLQLLKEFTNQLNIPVIGNNSIIDYNSAQEILKTGVQAFSVARAAQKNPLVFKEIV
jgi:TIM-barrel protein